MVESSEPHPVFANVKAEFEHLLSSYPSIDEVDFKNIIPLVMTWHIESYKIKKPEELKYLSERFILIDTKLGIATQFVPQLLLELDEVLQGFRKWYKPFDFKYNAKLVDKLDDHHVP
jgi:hypothetical protein